jgi:FO synthase
MTAPTASEFRRALARAREGKTLDLAELTVLLQVRGDDLAEAMRIAADLRDLGLEQAGRHGVITYSRKAFIPLTHMCRDRCQYCTFVQTPTQLQRAGRGLYLELDEVVGVAQQAAALECKEALFTLGDRPEDRWPEAREWLDARGYDSTLGYLRAAAVRVLEETGMLPHLNPGVMSWEEMARLKSVAPSMGLMLESSSVRLWSEPGQPHYGSPDKHPEVRLRTIEDAGRLAIPFTTGVLIGIGESPAELAQSLLDLRQLARAYGHVQEVIVQNFRAKPLTAMRDAADADRATYLAAIATARIVMGPRMRIQAPPNLSDAAELADLVSAGVDDWGGVSPLTPDHVNPERPWPHLDDLAALTRTAGFELQERLTAHPEFVLREDPFLDARIRPHVRALATSTGLAREGTAPVGMPWQEEDLSYEAFAAANAGGRVDLDTSIDTVGRTTDRRSDFDAVYGDWDDIRERVDHSAPAVLAADDVSRGLRLAADDPAALSHASNHALALALFYSDGAALQRLASIADDVRRDVVGEPVTYIVNRNLNFTNVCYTGCRFCAFAQRRTDADAFTLSLDEVAQRVRDAVAAGATEICMQGGIHPDLPGSAYVDLVRVVKQAEPDVHLHAFSPMEIVNGATRSGVSVREWLTEVRDAGLGSIPGTAAEILDDDVRWILTKGKLPTRSWVDIVTTAHEVGLPSSSTMMYGHVDRPEHWLNHLRLLRTIQEQTRGFTEFVALPFIHHNAPVYLAGAARPGPTPRENLVVHAMARLLLHGAIDNIQTSWVKLGPEGVVAMLNAGANDIGGTLMEETISRMAGSEHGSALEPAELVALAHSAGRPAVERTTLYQRVSGARDLDVSSA